MDDDTLLHRQVHPGWIIGNTISIQAFSSQTFKPTPKDKGLLSVYNGNKFAAYEAFEHYCNQGLKSVGVVAVTPAECKTVPVPVVEDNEPFDGHCSIDYRGLSGNRVKKAASILKSFAQERGWQYLEES